MTYENGDIVTADFVHGVKEGKVVMISPRSKNVSRIVGRCVKGKLEGKGKIISAETSVTDCFFRNGCIDGPVRRFTMKVCKKSLLLSSLSNLNMSRFAPNSQFKSKHKQNLER